MYGRVWLIDDGVWLNGRLWMNGGWVMNDGLMKNGGEEMIDGKMMLRVGSEIALRMVE